MPFKKLYDINLDTLTEMINIGFNIQEIANYFGCSKVLIALKVKQNNLPKVKPKNTVGRNDAKIVECIEKKGLNIRQTSILLGITYSGCYNRYKEVKRVRLLNERKKEWFLQNAKDVAKH